MDQQRNLCTVCGTRADLVSTDQVLLANEPQVLQSPE